MPVSASPAAFDTESLSRGCQTPRSGAVPGLRWGILSRQKLGRFRLTMTTATMEALTPVRPALRPPTGGVNTVSFGQQVSLIHASGPPIIPSPSTLGLLPSLSHPTPQRVRLPTRVGPGFAFLQQARQLSGRIEFVILRTNRSPPAAPHPASRTDAVAVGYRPESVYLKRTLTSPIKRAFRRTGGGLPSARR